MRARRSSGADADRHDGAGDREPPVRRRRTRSAATLAGPFRRVGVPADPVHLIGVRKALEQWARSADLPDATVADIVLAAYEAMANATEHAYRNRPGTIDVLATEDDTEVVAVVRDRGEWRTPPAEPGHRGRGLLMIRSLSRAEVAPGPDGTTVQMRWPRHR
jgi:anti-sigma regulatory factor (Ser/Thr protein kinase)